MKTILTDEDEPLLPKLTKRHREILLALNELEQPSYGAIAYHLQIPLGTVKSRLSRARACLRAIRDSNTIHTDQTA